MSIHVQYVRIHALWWVSMTERARETERHRSVLCARLPVTLWRWHTLLLDRWLGYSAGLAASSQERMEALCGRMSWTLWKGRSSQTEKKSRRRQEGGRINWWGGVRRAQGGECWQKQHPQKPCGPLSAPSSNVSGTRSRWAAWVVSWFQSRRQWEPRRNRYLCLLSGHVELSQPCLQGLGGAPRPIILSSPLCLSHKDIYTTGFFQWACFTYTHWHAYFPHCVWVSGCVRCALAGMQIDGGVHTKVKNMSFVPWERSPIDISRHFFNFIFFIVLKPERGTFKIPFFDECPFCFQQFYWIPINKW